MDFFSPPETIALTLTSEFQKSPKNDILLVPKKTTAVSSLFLAICLFVFIFAFISGQSCYIIVANVAMLTNVIRVPVLIIAGFKKNHINNSTSRLKKQQWEIIHAQQERKRNRELRLMRALERRTSLNNVEYEILGLLRGNLDQCELQITKNVKQEMAIHSKSNQSM